MVTLRQSTSTWEGAYLNGLVDEAQVFSSASVDPMAIYNAGCAGGCPEVRFARPVMMGVSVGNTTGSKYVCTKAMPCSETGTAGLLVHSNSDKTKKFILSASHVLGSVGSAGCPNTATRGVTWTLEPGTADIGTDPGNDNTFFLGVVADYIDQNKVPATNVADAAISATDPTFASTEIFRIGQPQGAEGVPLDKERVVKVGSATGVTHGVVHLCHGQLCNSTVNGKKCGTYKYIQQFRIVSSGIFCKNGDSGAAILDENSMVPIGLLFACSKDGKSATATPIKTIDQLLGVFPDSH